MVVVWFEQGLLGCTGCMPVCVHLHLAACCGPCSLPMPVGIAMQAQSSTHLSDGYALPCNMQHAMQRCVFNSSCTRLS